MIGLLGRFGLAIVAMACGAMAAAQVPGLPPPFGEAPKPVAGAQPAAEPRERQEERLRRQIGQLRAEHANPPSAPPGIGPDEVADLADARTLLIAANEVQLHALEQLGKLRAAREAAEAAERKWQGFEEPAPYSILLVDELRDAADAVRARIAAIERSTAHLKAEGERYAADLRRAEETLRRMQEAADVAAQADERARATWRRDLAQLRLRAVASRASVAQLLTQAQAEEATTRKAELALLKRKLDVATPGATFSEDDLAKAKQRLATLGAGVRAERAALASRIGSREQERGQAERDLGQLRAQADAPSEAVRIAEARLRAAETWVAVLRVERDLLEGLESLTEELARNWEARRIAATEADADARFAAVERLRASTSRFARWRGYVETLGETQRARLIDVEGGAQRSDALPGTLRYDQDAAAALRRGSAAVERAQDVLATTLRTLDRWIADVEAHQGTRSFAARAADGWSALKAGVREVWNFELFAVEDTAMVDGHEVRTSRGVTVGKSIGAFLVFIVGYWLAAILGRRVERGLVARGFDARRVRNYRRWALTAVAALLALFTLNVARIPLTVFAFLGGALAIGVGFGTQTIIRNFISGLILLAERRIQIGDIIEVDGVTGTVTSVDLRSSTVLGFEGVETSVPNSVLLENKVTNWTQTDRRVRRALKVGVAYGSPLRETAGVLEDCAKRHGVVLDDPAPQVILEDFGADSLVFALYFWVELRPGVSAMQVASDLRFMIAKGLAEAGIAIPFPQRDVHLDASAPLRVQVIRAPVAGP
jgi:potassium efflux system protein